VLETFLPQAASEEDIVRAFNAAKEANGWEAEKKNMGLFVKAIKAALPNADGKMVAGQMFSDGVNFYIAGKDGLILKGLNKTKDGTYMLDPVDGHMVIGFVQIGDGFFYFAEDGKMVAGATINIAGLDCTFDKNGKLIAPEGLVPPVVAVY
jgi:glucan-binding YG repeat protein